MRFEEIKDMFILGAKIKRKSWDGYWEYDPDRNDIIMHCKEGTVIMLKSESSDLEYTLSNICGDDWEIADEINTPLLGGKIGLNFKETVPYLRHGLKMRRHNWYSKDYIIKREEGCITKVEWTSSTKGFKDLKNIHNWKPTKQDLLSNDWEFYNEEE